MDDETPPKRVTRSRATTRTTTTEQEVKIATAAAKARVTRNTVATTTKRKTRADDVLEETKNDQEIDVDTMDAPPVKPKVTRGRKKATQSEPEVQVEAEAAIQEESSALAPGPAKATRGRPRKVIEVTPQPEPLKATRGRPRKAAVVEEPAVETAPEPVKKITRGRATAASKVAAAHQPAEDAVTEPVKKTGRGCPAAATKPVAAPKKSVKFDEPEEQDKENIIPIENSKGKVKDVETATGLRARPVRKPTVSTRAVRGRPKAADGAEKLPLTPKKATQVATAKDNVSEDELATMEKTPMKPLTKSPFKAHGSVLGSNRKLDFTTSITANRAVTQDLGASLMGSPARRPPPSPFKDSLKTSPKRVNMGDSMMRSSFKSSMPPPNTKTSPFKTSPLQSPARRPPSPVKFSATSSPTRDRPALGATPKAAPFSISRFNATPRTLNKPVVPPGRSLLFSPSKDPTGDITPHDGSMNVPAVAPFPGRLSCILPRDADPTLQDSEDRIDLPQNARPSDDMLIEEEESSAPQTLDAMVIDEVQEATDIEEQRSTTPTNSPPRYSIGSFALHAEQDPFENSDSEDELASGSPKYSPAPLKASNISAKDFAAPSTPTLATLVHKTPKTAIIPRSREELFHGAARSQSVRARKDKSTFTPLARQLSDWMSAAIASDSSSSSSEEEAKSPDPTSGIEQGTSVEIQAVIRPSPAKSSFFEDAMSVSDAVAEVENAGVETKKVSDDLDAMDFAPTTLDEEDLALAAEADEMSLISVHTEEDTGEIPDVLNQSVCGDVRAVSETSQEYGDENAAPADQNQASIDPVLLALDAQHHHAASVPTAQQVFTPVRVLGEREIVFHTISKVPLKPAAEDSPLKVSKKSASASRMLAQRHAPLPPSFVIPQLPAFASPAVVTPARSNNWSTAATPVRTPRRDLNDQILKGAVVYADVHTSEGADASAVFVELLVQMGAKCVKSWNWNPNSSNSSESESGSQDGDKEQAANANGKIGITHVVFKDGGKRTLEKVRESNGVVLCVGVGWVLEYVSPLPLICSCLPFD
jgi:hypothetical protein